MSSDTAIDRSLLSDLVRCHRQRRRLSLREAAVEARVSAPTLQRVEAGQMPTALTLLRLADWLGMSVDDLRGKHPPTRQGTVQQIEVFLRADPKLDKDTATAIANIVREVYDGFAKGKKAKK